MHMHISWTEMRDGHAYWRMMADLNPAHPVEEDTQAFEALLRSAAPEQYEAASAEGDRYFYIPALQRHRGVKHFYLENYASGDDEADTALAQKLGRAVVDGYADILKTAIARPHYDEDRAAQLAYHTLYLFQVLTLDRGTTSGLLVHDQNDAGIMGSLPSHVDGELLASWEDRMVAPQDELLRSLCEVLGTTRPTEVTDARKLRLAQAVRAHYQKHPKALALQASGHEVPPTVQNHQ